MITLTRVKPASGVPEYLWPNNWDSEDLIPLVDEIYEYVCHLPGGMVEIRTMNHGNVIANPNAFKELR